MWTDGFNKSIFDWLTTLWLNMAKKNSSHNILRHYQAYHDACVCILLLVNKTQRTRRGTFDNDGGQWTTGVTWTNNVFATFPGLGTF